MSTERRRMVMSVEEAVPAERQHTKPCGDCPWRRDSLAGWLGGPTPREWVKEAHSEEVIECHTRTGAQCAGVAIYRGNVCKRPRSGALVLLADRTNVFGTPTEFMAHHSKDPEL